MPKFRQSQKLSSQLKRPSKRILNYVIKKRNLHLEAIRAENDSDHFCASSGGGRADKEDSVLLRRRNPSRSRISDL